MKIYIYNVDNNLILKYCKIIIALEKQYSSELEYARSQIHQEILDSIGINKAGVFRDERRFMTALAQTIAELTYIEKDEIGYKVLNPPINQMSVGKTNTEEI